MGTGEAHKDHKKIRARFVFDVKYDGRDKARLVEDRHLTDDGMLGVYSDVTSLRGIRLVLFLAELNGLESWGDRNRQCLLRIIHQVEGVHSSWP